MAWWDSNAVVVLNGVASGLLLFMMAVGLTVIFGLMDVLNLSHGAFYLAGSYLAYAVIGETVSTWGGFFLAIVVAIVGGIVLGGLLMALTAPLSRRGHLDQALLTLGLALVIGQVLQIIFGVQNHSVAPPPGLTGSVQVLASQYPVYRLFVIAIGAVVAAGVWYFVEKTPAGALVRAAVADSDMVSAVGIDVRRVKAVVFVSASVLALIGGVLAGPIRGVSAGLGDETLILALVVIVIGSAGSIVGTLVGSLVIGLTQNIGVLFFPEVASFLVFGVMVIVILLRPQGLFPRVAVAR
ncbi:MAG: branched-chain amino acid ABC transporter permease [Terrimesophilobacter sp.]